MQTALTVSSPFPPQSSAPSPSRILVVDDEVGIRMVFELQLQRDGYDVVCAENGVEALKMLQAGEFDLLITDLEMPEMNGYELIRQAQQLWPALPIFICSGKATDPALPEDVRNAASSLLQKPVTMRQLSEVVGEFLREE